MPHPRRGRLVLLLALPMLVLTLTGTPASAAMVVNDTFHVPAYVDTNPCFSGDVLNLNGNIHVVITSTVDKAGGVHTTLSLNSNLRGTSITTGTRYVSSETGQDVWYTRGPFPAVHTTTTYTTLVSQGRTPNYVLRTTWRTTVSADGTAVAVMDEWHVDCQG
jgi:hypothetical protein